jgi:hypothetical protein
LPTRPRAPRTTAQTPPRARCTRMPFLTSRAASARASRDRRRAAAAVSVAEEGEVDGDIGGGLCCDAGGDEVRAEAGVCAQRAEEEGIFGGGPVARWRTEERGVGRFGRLGRAGGVVMRGGDVGGDVLGEVGVGLESGQGGGFQVLLCVCICIWQAWTLWVQGVLEERGGERTLTRNIRSVGGLTYELCSGLWPTWWPRNGRAAS